MGGPRSNGSPIAQAAGAAGPHTIEAFKLLSNETRLAILLVLWEAYDPRTEAEGLSFTQLYERAGARDSGNFSYHLDKLVGHFVEETKAGYTLSNAGRTIVRAIIAGTGLEEQTLSSTEIPRSCPWCGSSVELSYEDQRLYQVCTECEGSLGPRSTERTPVGTLVVHDGFNPAGLTGRTPEEVFVAGTIEYHRTVTLVIRGVCPECSGRVEESLHLCDDHESRPGEVCPTCGTWNEARVGYVCSVCKYNVSYPAWAAVFDHPAIVAFYYDQGFEGTYDLGDPRACGRLWNRMLREQSIVSRDPLRIQVLVTCGDAVLALRLDGNLDVIEMAREEREPVGPRTSV